MYDGREALPDDHKFRGHTIRSSAYRKTMTIEKFAFPSAS